MSVPPSFTYAATTALLLASILVGRLTERRVPEPLAAPLDQISARIAGWQAIGDETLPPRTVQVLDPTSYLSRTYAKNGSQLNLFVAYYAQQRAGESMHSPKHCLPGSGWEIWKHDSASIPVNGQTYRVNKYSIQNLGVRMLMLYWYQSKRRIVSSEYMGKILLARDTVATGYTGGSIVRIIVPDTSGAAGEGIAFAEELIPQLQRCFGTDGPLMEN